MSLGALAKQSMQPGSGNRHRMNAATLIDRSTRRWSFRRNGKFKIFF